MEEDWFKGWPAHDGFQRRWREAVIVKNKAYASESLWLRCLDYAVNIDKVLLGIRKLEKQSNYLQSYWLVHESVYCNYFLKSLFLKSLVHESLAQLNEVSYLESVFFLCNRITFWTFQKRKVHVYVNTDLKFDINKWHHFYYMCWMMMISNTFNSFLNCFELIKFHETRILHYP